MRISVEKTAEMLKEANSVVITAHINPDGDALGSCLGLMHIMESLGKKAQVLIDDDFSPNFKVLPGYERVHKPEAESYEADYLVLLDASLDRCGRVAEKCKAPVINIDHHVSNDEKAGYLCLDAKAAACAELLYRIAKTMEVRFTLEMAANLYTGIVTDTGYFRYSNTTPYTMRAAAELLETGLKPEVFSQALETRSFAHMKGMAAAMQTMEISDDGKVAGVYLDYELLSQMESTEGFIDLVRVIEGVDVTLLMKAVEPDVCRVSMRSRYTDVSRIAISLGGGGHIRAAGCTINKPFAEAKEIVLKAIREALV
ncbi:MAG: bifunctional oligoribonuclease/PAP phosphatase NrnA [Selenomonadales bacterium]|nr:bifunctional oligoribonuclease/PAP phosphatase NrnA [Selenomonadales bacterium]MDD6218834.1 bifunctional oligoribonuclease/PAP phosphatase NrnA [Selenomonadaceae bacterium]